MIDISSSDESNDDDDNLNVVLNDSPSRATRENISSSLKRKRVSLSPLQKDVTNTCNKEASIDVNDNELHLYNNRLDTTYNDTDGIVVNSTNSNNVEVIKQRTIVLNQPLALQQQQSNAKTSSEVIDLTIDSPMSTPERMKSKHDNRSSSDNNIPNESMESSYPSTTTRIDHNQFLSFDEMIEHDKKECSTTIINNMHQGLLVDLLPNSSPPENVAIHDSRIENYNLQVIDSPKQIHKKPLYSLRTSAYLQNLAEISFTIQNDIRWRCSSTTNNNNSWNGNSNKHNHRLFDWNNGDDMSIVTKLANYYLPLPTITPTTQTTEVNNYCCCCCLLRRAYNNNSNTTTTIELNDECCHNNKFDNDMNHIEEIDSQDSNNDNEKNKEENYIDDDDEIRQIYLYCRLFYRKGPWFRFDDMYWKYYVTTSKINNDNPDIAPKINDNNKDLENNDSIVLEDGCCTDDNMEATDVEIHGNNDTPTRISIMAALKDIDSINVMCSHVNIEQLVIYLDRFMDLVLDIKRLLGIGWFRTFLSEQECGKIVGITLLKVDERDIILSKIGGGKKMTKKNVASTRNKSWPNTDKQHPKKNHTDTNLIWQQMSQQKQLSFFSKNTTSKQTTSNDVLPIRDHVNDIIFDKLIHEIIKKCSISNNSLSHSFIKEVTVAIQLLIKKTFQEDSNSKDDLILLPMCFRLREKPTLTLRRFIRLYLCATGGPGNMRGDGTNGWTSLLDTSSIQLHTPLYKHISPIGDHNWHTIQYPGLSYRFGMTSYCFMSRYKYLPVNVDHHERDSSSAVNDIFHNREPFLSWELTVEIRAFVDYLIELNDTLRSNQRRIDKGKKPKHGGKILPQQSQTKFDSVDIMGILNEQNRRHIVKMLLRSMSSIDCVSDIMTIIEQSIHTHQVSFENGSECEKVLATIGIVVIHVLAACNKRITDDEVQMVATRPWLRHLYWPSCLSYILWDIFPLFERAGVHTLAIQALEVLLFGFIHQSDSIYPSFPNPTVATKLAPFMLSRRAKGKAFDRLIIDYVHLHRRLFVNIEDKAVKKASSVALQKHTETFCELVVKTASQRSSIGFSAIRTVSRRLKQPLSTTLQNMFSMEANELGIRLENNNDDDDEAKTPTTKYSDWCPVTDRAVANSLESNSDDVGARCAFVGFEDEFYEPISSTSLNVEQLALEYYRTGRLPAQENDCNNLVTKGGWSGYHDEGGHVRALFRILCSAAVLGMDWGCESVKHDIKNNPHHATLHLTPYQSAPFDLHVGFELLENNNVPEHSQFEPSPGFYYRRQHQISSFLARLSTLKGQDLCDLVHESILSRLHFMVLHKRKDISLERDLAQTRTLSMIAAGCGGKQLSSIFRCLFFDYRHYSGGLPDLLLFRPSYDDDTSGIVHLGEWIGCGEISSEYIKPGQQNSNILIDRDDEYLGCSKLGDSGGGRTSRSGTGSQNATNIPSRNSAMGQILSMDMIPEKLLLQHSNRNVKVECMMVEVKSSNDRLDPRQEDWLNVLDHYGIARVCKFEKQQQTKEQAMDRNM